ncbi:dihydrofolate reductase family protein [Brachybacterium sp. FME24]|uniref:dihydrofolate reductase family protein n=1 Tax=Brachybacterium sp. FME24 TaxID=2742605 RepID=UPI001868BB06|nr:dihydrofolate reductase family protein [Brachybacterium sp. FME24]
MGKVAWGFTASLDGFIAGPGHDMSWLEAMEAMEPTVDDVTESMAAPVGVIISGRAGYDAARAQAQERSELTAQAYGGAWSGTEFVLTHRPHEIDADPAIVALNCDVREAVRRAQEVAGEKDVQIISADIARQALEHDLIDELQMFVAPVFLGDGTRIFAVPGGRLVQWELVETLGDSSSQRGWIFRPRRRS